MLSRLVHRLLTVAAHRWPAADRAELIREWVAESHTLGHEPGVPGRVRAWRQIRFAASLACARRSQIATVGAIPVDRVERTALHVAALFLAPLAAAILAMLANGPLWMSTHGGDPPAMLTLLYRAGQVVAGAGCGALLADQLRRRRGEPVSRLWCVAATIPVLAGLVAADSAVRHLSNAETGPAYAVTGTVALALALVPLTVVVAALARRATRWAVIAAIPGTAAIVLAATAVVVARAGTQIPTRADGNLWWWLPELARLAAPTYHRLPGVNNPYPVETVLPILPGIMLGTVALSLAYTVRAVRPRPPAPLRPRPAPAPHRLVPTIMVGGGLFAAHMVTPFDWWVALPAAVVALAALATNAFCFAVAFWLATRILATRSTAGRSTADRITAGRRGSARPEVPGQPGRSWREMVAWGGAAGAALGWAVTLAYLTPNIGLQTPWPHIDAVPAGWAEWDTSTGRVWMQDLQMYAICCFAVCLAAAAAYRGASLLPALASPVVLLAATIGVIRSGWHTPPALPWLAAGALLLTIAAWSATSHFGRYRQRPPERSRLLVRRLAVLAAFLIPGSYLHGVLLSDGPPVPPVALAVTVGLSTVLAVIASAAVTASSARTSIRTLPDTTAAAWSLTVGAGVAVFGTAVFSGAAMTAPATYPLMAAAPAALAVPAAVLAIAAIRAPGVSRAPGATGAPETSRAPRPADTSRFRRSVVRRIGLGLGRGLGLGVALLAAGYLALICGIVLAFGFGQLLPWLEYQQSYDPFGYLPGGVALGLLLAFLTPYLIEPRGTYPARSVVPVPSPAVADAPPSR